MIHLVVNAGSTSIKVAVFEFRNNTIKEVERLKHTQLTSATYKRLFNQLQKKYPYIKSVTHRIVHGGKTFYKPTLMNAANLKKLKALKELAPLHNPIECAYIEDAWAFWPKAKNYAVFDTAFFHDLPQLSQIYPLSKAIRKWGVQKYGFHGISHKDCLDRLYADNKINAQSKVITCHLGGGCSITGSINFKPLDTTMGFTPLDGTIMSTRPGSLDPGILLYLLENKKMSLKKLNDELNYNSGLKGLYPKYSQFQLLEKNYHKDAQAKLALDLFSLSIAQHIAKIATSLKGLDTLVFTGGIGENSALLRKKVIEHLLFLKLHLSSSKNEKKQLFEISSPKSSVSIFVLKADEEVALLKTHLIK